MKLTKRLLAMILAAAMLVGMVAINSSAVQLDDDVPTLTEDDCTTFDLENNPYKVKIGFKVYKVNTDDGSYELLPDTIPGNDTNDVKVQPGDVIRVEIWAQTNFHCYAIQMTPAYSNAWLLPTTQAYETFDYIAASAGDKVSIEDGMPPMENFDDSYGAGDGSFDAPIYINECLTYSKAQTNHNNISGIKGILPKTWKGTGTTAANYYNKNNADIVDADGNFKYNMYEFGAGYSAAGDEAYGGYAAVLNAYQPLVTFNLTVAEGATGTADLFIPEEAILAPTNTTGRTFFTALANVQDSANYDPGTPQITIGAGVTQYKQYCQYAGDTTKYDKAWDITNTTISIDNGTEEPEPETTTEPPTTEPPVEYADLAALQAAIARAATADKTNCTSASVAEFEAALAAANALNVEGTLKSEQDAVDAAATRLENAITGLTKLGTCNYAELDAAIAAYEAKVADSYKYANWADYTALYEAAKAVTRDMIADEANVNQGKIDAAAAALNNFALVEKSVDYTAWNAAVATIPADLTAYTPNSVAAFEAAKAAAEAAKDAAVAAYDQAALDQAAADLEAAIALLAPKADKAALQAAITRASALDADDYTPDSWAAADLATVLAAANEVNADPNATAAAVADAVAAIEAAEAKLDVKADKGALADAIAAAKAIDAAEYTPDSWSLAGLENAIGSAETVYNDGNATAEAVAGAIAALEAAAAKLVKLADKAALKAAIDTLPAVTEDKAIEATWKAYEAELAEANAVYADPNATQGAVDAAEAELLAAIAGVKPLGNCDYTVLDEAIAAYEAKLADKDLYENWAAYEAAYDAAKAIARDMIADEAGANQKTIDDAAAALNAVVLVYKAADYAAVEAAKAKIPADLNDGKYTSASVQAVEDAVAAVVEGYDITKQAEVDAFAAAIEEAVANLAPLGACDYAELDAAIAAYEAKVADKDLYANWAEYEAAYDAAKAVDRDMIADEAGENQDEIDAAAAALTAVVLEYKAADYSAVDAAKDAAAAIDATKYTSASVKAVNDAVAAVVEGYDITKQAEVDAMAKAINDAIAALVDLEACDYAALDAALALVPAEAEDAYTALTWKAYAEAKAEAEGIARDLLADEDGVNQAKIDAAAAALVDAYNALKINVANITSVDYDSEGVFAQASLAYAFKVNGAPSKIQVITAGGSTMTFDRRSTKVSLVSYNEAGEVVDYANEDPAYEIWTINLALKAGDYTVKAKYGYVWDTEAYAFAVEYDEYEAEAEAFTASVGEYVDATEVTAAKGETITFKAITDTTVTKIQMVLAGGSTSTYTTSKAVNNGDGTLTWTITRTFTKSQDINLKVKTPSGWGTESVGNVKVTIG